MKNLLSIVAIAATAIGGVLPFGTHAQTIVMQPFTTFGSHGDGSIRPGDYSFITETNGFQRGMAYNPSTGHLLVVDRSPNSSANCDVHVLNGETGEWIKTLNTSILDGGNASFKMNLIGVADDGAIYVGNLSNSTTTNNPQYRLYRWANEDADQVYVYPPPIQDYLADPGNQTDTNTFQKRWGDTLAVRGSGTNTQVLIANRGTLAAVFMPTNGNMNSFMPTTLVCDAGTNAFGYGLTFGAGNTFWGTSGAASNGPLYYMQFDLAAHTATKIHTLTSSNFPGTITPILCMPSSNLLAGITMVTSNDIIRLYDISNPANPILMDRKSFPTAFTNANYAGALTLGTNGVLYALDTDNGIVAFRLTNAASNTLPPAFLQNPANTLAILGNTTTLSASADGQAPIYYQWMQGTNIVSGATNSTLVLTNVQLSQAGSYSVVATNANGSATSSSAILNVAISAPTAELLYDAFPYAPGSTIAGQGNWALGSGTASAVGDAGSLSVAGLASSISNKMTWGNINMNLRTSFGSTIASGPVYGAFAYKLDPTSTIPAAGASGGAVAGFQNATITTTYYTKVVVRANSAVPGTYLMGLFKGGGENYGGFATNVLALGDTVFVVVRYTFKENSTTDDTIDLWVNPDPSTFGANNAPPPSMGEGGVVVASGAAQNDAALLDRLTFRASSGPSKTYVDELRIGLAWADVTPAALSAQPRLTISRSGTDVTVTWPASYTGFTLEGTPSLSSPTWSSISYSISGGNNTATIPASTGIQFIRVRK